MELLPHQVEGVEFFLAKKAGLLAFEQGLGKTLTALAAFAHLRAAKLADRLVVLCPNSLKRNWEAEANRFFPEFTVAVIDTAGRQRKAQLSATAADMLIVNYEAARAEVTVIRGLLARRRCVLVLDESHAIKNTATISHVATQNLGELTPYRWLLTGTPYTNTVADLYAQLAFVDPSGAIGPKDRFLVKFANAAEQPAELVRLLSRYMLRKTKADCLSLPAKLFDDRSVLLPEWQREIYSAVRDGLVGDVGAMTAKEFERFLPRAVARLLRLWQIASNPALVIPSETRMPGKFEALDLILKDSVGRRGLKVIVWSSFVQTIELLDARYAGAFATGKLHGGVPTAERAATVARFQESPEPMALFANPAVAATGFTMTASPLAVYETMSWRYDFFAQSQDRNHRIGQKSDVTYIRLIARDTVDEQIVQRVEKKMRAAATLLDGKSGSTPPELAAERFTRKEFLELVRGA